MSFIKLIYKTPEKAFLHDYIIRTTQKTRLGILLALVLYLSFSYLDYFMLPKSYHEVWTIRFLVFLPFSLLMLLLTYVKKVEKYHPYIAFITILGCGLGITAMIAVSKPMELGFHSYYVGLILSIMWAYSTLPLQTNLANLVAVILIVSYNLVAIFIQHENIVAPFLLVNNNFFLVSILCIGVMTSATTRSFIIESYRKEELLLKEKEELHQTHKELEKSDNIKNKLLSIISHDVRNPIANLKSILNMHSSKIISEDEFKLFTGKLMDSIDKTSILLDTLLSWSMLQLEDNKGPKKKAIALHPFVNEIFCQIASAAERKGNYLHNRVESSVEVYADPIMLGIVIRNLLTNSIKFTESGEVTVYTFDAFDNIYILIQDNGIGIEHIKIASLFSLATNSTSGTRNEIGSGFGLFVCKEFIELHGGTISAESTLGTGTTISFTIPEIKKNSTENRTAQRLQN